LAQQAIMTDKQKKLVLLMGEDLKTLQHAEYHGIKFDFDRACQKVEKYTKELDEISAKLSTFLPSIKFGVWNWDSGVHLSALLYGGKVNFDYSISEEAIYKSGPQKGDVYTRRRWFVETVELPRRFLAIANSEVKLSVENKDPNHTKVYQTDAPTLSQLKSRKKEDKELLQLLNQRSEKTKVVEMIQSIINKSNEMNWQDGYLHPQFNQNIAITGRLSSSAPNMQNTPEEIDELLVSRYDD
jgi:type II secretory ATPase GspE/PulE/Tfp pilus assembly ATPase PilB-like protein